MATSGNVSSAFTAKDTVVFSWWVDSGGQSVTNNTTTVKWKLELVAGASGQIISSVYKNWKVIVDGNTYTGQCLIGVSNNSTITLASGSTTVSHKSDGTKTFSFSFYQEIGITFNGTYIASASGSGSGTLNTIPRKSSLTVPNGTLGVLQAVTVTKQEASFTHTVTYSCGSLSGTICTKVSDNYVNWTPPMDLATQNTTGTSVIVNFTVETFNGSASVGTSTATAVYQIPASVTPYMASTLSDPTGWYDVFGAYIQGQSKLGLSINAQGSYGASITGITTIFDGSTYIGSSVTSNTILQTGSVQASITAKDSRGRTVTEKPTISVLAYAYPKLTAVSSYRSDSSGNSSSSGGYITVKFSSSVYSLNSKNGAWYKVKYKKSTASSYTTVSLDSYTGNFAVSNGKYTFAADEGSYDVQVLVGDRFKTIPYSVPGPAVNHTVSMLKKDGKVVGLAVGKTAEHEGYFDVGWKLKLSGGGDCIEEQGESNGWIYRKWASGVAECQKIVTVTTKITTAWGSMYVGDTKMARQSYPVVFLSKPAEVASLTSGGSAAWIYPESGGNGVNGGYSSAIYNVARPSSVTTDQTFYISIYATGKWK